MKHRKAVNRISIAIVAVVILFIVGLKLVDVIAKSVIDSELTALLGVDAHVGGVDLGVLTSRSSFTNIKIKNPPEFAQKYIITIDRADIDCGVGTLMSDNIDIKEVTLKGLVFDLEEVDKKINIEEVIKNIQEYVKSLPPTNTSTELNIHVLKVQDVRLTASGAIVTIAGGKIDQQIPDFQVTNIGTKSDTSRMSNQFVSILTHSVLSHVFKNPINGLSGVTMSSLHSVFGEIPFASGGSLADGIRDLGNVLGGGGEDEEKKEGD